MLPEVQFNRDHGDIDPCPTCLQIISEVFDDHLEEDEEREMTDDELYADPYGIDVV